MKLVLEITSHAGDGSITHRSIESFPSTLGRGYHNDIIIGDPHISAQHVRIDVSEQGFVIHDLGSENGITLNDKHHRGATVTLKSGDTVKIGRTDIRIYDPQHPVPPAQKLQRANPVLVWLANPLTVWTSFALIIGVSVGWQYLEVWSDDLSGPLGGTAFGVAVAILVWSALWGVTGRLVRHKSRFRSHVALVSLFGTLMVVGSVIESYAAFLSNENWLADAVNYLVNGLLCAGLIYGSLTLATDMSQRKRRFWAGMFVVGAIVCSLGLAQTSKGHFSSSPDYASRLEPYFAALAPADSVDGFMKENDQLFSSDVFKEKDTDD